MLRSSLVGILAALFFCASTSFAAVSDETNPVLRQPAASSPTQLHRVLVKLHASVQSASGRVEVKLAAGPARDAQVRAQELAQAQALASRVSLTLMQSREITAGLHAMQVQPAPGESIADTLARLQADPSVEYAVADERRYPLALPNDPLFTGQWYLQNAQPAAIDAQTAWDTTTGRSDLVIADVDTGVRYDHPDLKSSTLNRLLPGYDFISDSAVANDGDGRDADASDPGDWVSSSRSAESDLRELHRRQQLMARNARRWASWEPLRTTPRASPESPGKGRFCRCVRSASAAASTPTFWMRCAGRQGCTSTACPTTPTPAQIINLSLGSTGSCTAAQQQVINEVVSEGVLIVVSAGNEGGPVDSPANCNGVAGVAGLRNVGTKVGFSSLGPQIALSAPGGKLREYQRRLPVLRSIPPAIPVRRFRRAAPIRIRSTRIWARASPRRWCRRSPG